MLPTRDQIEKVAYDRWIRRHRAHGHDRDDWLGSETELTFTLNYQTIAEFPLGSSGQTIVGGDTVLRCRFCERIARHTAFSRPRAIVQGIDLGSLVSAQICDECQSDCRDPLEPHCQRFWDSLGDAMASEPALARSADLIAVYKSLVASAMLIMPERELAYFTDTLEWLSNPDHEYDADMFAGASCLVYGDAAGQQPVTTLVRRVDDDAPVPYVLYFVANRGTIVQISVPLCVRDHDLDGRGTELPCRSLTTGEGPHFAEIRPRAVRLVEPLSRSRAMGRRALLLK